MKVTLESTSKIVTLNGVQCRIWEGTTESGVQMHAFVMLVAAKEGQDLTQFERELKQMRTPSPEIEAIPLRMIL
jgi:hypothetical protein